MTFKISDKVIVPQDWRSDLESPNCGAFATFEGWVRNNNDGFDVTCLEYQAYEVLAHKEGERILTQAKKDFPIEQVFCVHRVGLLEIGEIAVFVGVSSKHRDEAFRACRFIIDEVKYRVPIWKKEFYSNGDSGWVNCEACADQN
ncbi:MAG: molybdenum cofactor biosynthesis protein MoaE [Pseudomonadota bacterium]|nr:molybdenum cofactor biosynthesis protein MoaE [Pseudomonadota bacterium]